MKLFFEKKLGDIFRGFISNRMSLFFIGIVTVLGNVSNAIFFISLITKRDFSIEKVTTENGVIKWAIDFFASYWIPILIIGLLFVCVHSLLELLLPYLPDKYDYPIAFNHRKQYFQAEPIKLNLIVSNKRNKKFVDCRIKLTSLVYVNENGDEREQIYSIGSSYLLWENGEIERTIDESFGDKISFATTTLVKSSWAYNIIDFYDKENEKRLSDKGIYKFKVVVSGKNLSPVPHEGHFEFRHKRKEVDESTLGLPENKDVDFEREYIIPDGITNGYRKFAQFGFVNKKTKVTFEP
jgi:hypothetical protein